MVIDLKLLFTELKIWFDSCCRLFVAKFSHRTLYSDKNYLSISACISGIYLRISVYILLIYSNSRQRDFQTKKITGYFDSTV